MANYNSEHTGADIDAAVLVAPLKPRTETEVTTALAALPAGSFVISAVVNADPIETEKPVVTAFVLGIVTDLTVAVDTFTATDDTGVTGYLITSLASEPALGDAGWNGTAQTSYTAASAGLQNAYAWAKDASGNISLSATDTFTAVAPADAVPVFDTQPTEDSKTDTTVTVAFGWSDAEGDNALLESSTDNGATWQTEVASQAPGAGKTQLIDTLSVDGTSPLVASTAYTIKLRLTALTGNTTPVESNSVVITTDAPAVETPFAFDPANKDALIALSASDYVATKSGAGWKSGKTTVSKSTLNRYFEFNVDIAGVGIALMQSGAANSNFAGADTLGIMYTSVDGKVYFNGVGSIPSPAIGTATGFHRITCAWESSTGKIWFGLNAAPDIGATAHGTLAGPLFPSVSMITAGASVTLHDIDSTFVYTPPVGYVGFGV